MKTTVTQASLRGGFYIYKYGQTEAKVKLTKANHKLAKAISASMPAISAGQYIRSLAYFIYKKGNNPTGIWSYAHSLPMVCPLVAVRLPGVRRLVGRRPALGRLLSAVWLPIGRRMDVVCVSFVCRLVDGCPPFGCQLVAGW